MNDSRVLILGGAGMLGHKVWQRLQRRFRVFVTLRSSDALDVVRTLGGMGEEVASRVLVGVNGEEFATVERALDQVRPQVVVNCIGIIKQLPGASDPVLSIGVNSLLPHLLARSASLRGARLIHISTDCVFAGRRGIYRESDPPDAEDLYGRSKLLGEVAGAGCVTLRTSIIGRELRASSGLVEWFLSNRGGSVDGYDNAIFSGLTTLQLADTIGDVIERHASLEGLYHVSNEPIDKLTLLRLLDDAYGAGVIIRPSSAVRIDRSLDSTRFREATAWTPSPWPVLIREMAADVTPYDEWRMR